MSDYYHSHLFAQSVRSIYDKFLGDETMKHIGTKEIETDRLVLRRFVNEDAKIIFKNYANDDETTKYLTWSSHREVSVTQAILATWVEGYGDLSQYKWAITLKENPSEAIGDITASVSPNYASIDACEIGYVLSRKHWGKGYMSEAMEAVTNYLLKEAGFNRVIARHDVANPASGKVMQKAGLQFEGIHRQGSLNNTGIIDTAQYAILREDLEK